MQNLGSPGRLKEDSAPTITDATHLSPLAPYSVNPYSLDLSNRDRADCRQSCDTIAGHMFVGMRMPPCGAGKAGARVMHISSGAGDRELRKVLPDD